MTTATKTVLQSLQDKGELSDGNPMLAALAANYDVYMINKDIEGFLSDMSLILQCHVEDEEETAEALFENRDDFVKTFIEDQDDDAE